jgi:hypothetical protein
VLFSENGRYYLMRIAQITKRVGISNINFLWMYSNDTANAKKAGVLMLKAEEIIDSNSTVDAIT